MKTIGLLEGKSCSGSLDSCLFLSSRDDSPKWPKTRESNH